MAKTAAYRSAGSAKDTSSSSTRGAKKLIEKEGLAGKLFPSASNPEEVELDESFWRNAKVVMPGELGKVSVHLRVDPDVLAWFKSKGKGHLTRMNAVLRAYYEANRTKKAPARKKAS
jgi:uncharacterized protein (DUF4415 family)